MFHRNLYGTDFSMDGEFGNRDPISLHDVHVESFQEFPDVSVIGNPGLLGVGRLVDTGWNRFSKEWLEWCAGELVLLIYSAILSYFFIFIYIFFKFWTVPRVEDPDYASPDGAFDTLQ